MMLRGALFAILTVCTLVVSCGGGGGSNSSSSGGGTNPNIAAQVAACEAKLPKLLTAGLSSNEASVLVDAGPCAYGVPYGSPSGTAPSVFVLGAANIAYTSVTVCVPGTANCQTIDHVMVDTGSSGLRIMSSVLNANFTLPAMQLNGAPMIECEQFADGYSWGSVRTADVKIGGPSNTAEVANSVNVQVIGDADSYTTPSACSGTGPALNGPASFGANGVLGVGLFVNDCATLSSCPSSANLYFSCPSANACAAAPTLANGSDQVSNPVASFGTDSAGVVLSLPAVTNATGEVNVFGTMTFVSASLANSTAAGAGVGVYLADGYGDFSSAITNASAPYTAANETCANSFIDSGSNGLFLPLTVTTQPISTDANGWFTPLATVDLTALVTGAALTGATNTIDPSNHSPSIPLTIANADTALFAANGGTNTAFSDLGGSSGGACYTGTSGTESSSNATSGIDWGLPFFYGRPILVGLETTTLSVSGTTYYGPLWAF